MIDINACMNTLRFLVPSKWNTCLSYNKKLKKKLQKTALLHLRICFPVGTRYNKGDFAHRVQPDADFARVHANPSDLCTIQDQILPPSTSAAVLRCPFFTVLELNAATKMVIFGLRNITSINDWKHMSFGGFADVFFKINSTTLHASVPTGHSRIYLSWRLRSF